LKTERTRKLPLFFTQVIGSLPRPKVVRDLLAGKSEISPDRFEKTMDEMIVFAIRLQERAGIDVISDGEWRRRHYIGEFFTRVGGFERVRKYEHQGQTKLTEVVVRRMTAREPVYARDGEFLAKNTDRCTKFALPSPFLIAIRYWHPDYSTAAYPTMQLFMDHLTDLLAAEAKALSQAGIDVIQLDDPALTYFCDPRLTGASASEIHDERLRREWNIDEQFPQALAAINRITDGLQSEAHLHCCHSVYKRQSDVTGDYKPILPRLAGARIDRVNLEFAYHGTGHVDDLALLPAHLDVGMGVVDVRSEKLQEISEIESIAAAGAERIDPRRIALNPDCGFAPDAGEPPTIDEAYEKLCRLSAAAKRLRQKFSQTSEET